MPDPRDLEAAEKALAEMYRKSGLIGPPQAGVAELMAELMGRVRADAAMIPGTPHAEIADCPTYYDRCNCDTETLVHNIDRAERAEARAKELEGELARLRLERQ